MRDPKRLQEGDATPLERQLLEAAKGETLSPELKARMQQGLGFWNAPAPVAPIAKIAAPAGWTAKGILTLVGLGLVVAVPVVLLATRHHLGTSAQQAAPRSEPSAAALSAEPAPITVAAGTARPSLSRDRPVSPRNGSLRDEIRLLDGARAALVADDPQRALAELRRYGDLHPEGTLRPEAVALRVEVLEVTGQRSQAKELGRQFLAEHPTSPLAERVSKIVRR